MKTIDYIKSLNENEVYSKKARIEFNLYEIRDTILPYLESLEDCHEREVLLKALDNAKLIKYSTNKAIAAEKATAARTKKAKEKIQNAINILKMEDKKITYYSVAKTSGVSYTTVKKYITLNEIINIANKI